MACLRSRGRAATTRQAVPTAVIMLTASTCQKRACGPGGMADPSSATIWYVSSGNTAKKSAPAKYTAAKNLEKAASRISSGLSVGSATGRFYHSQARPSLLCGRPAVPLQDPAEVARVRPGDHQGEAQVLAAARQLYRVELAVRDAHVPRMREAVVDGEAVSEAEVVAAAGMGLEIEGHGQGLAAGAQLLRQAEVHRPPFLADQHGAREQVARAVADLDRVEDGVGAGRLWPERAERDLGAEQPAGQPRDGGDDPRCCGPAALHRAAPPSCGVLFQGAGATSRLCGLFGSTAPGCRRISYMPIRSKFLRRGGENARKCASCTRPTVMLAAPAFPPDARHSCSTGFTSSSPATWPSISAPRTR